MRLGVFHMSFNFQFYNKLDKTNNQRSTLALDRNIWKSGERSLPSSGMMQANSISMTRRFFNICEQR